MVQLKIRFSEQIDTPGESMRHVNNLGWFCVSRVPTYADRLLKVLKRVLLFEVPNFGTTKYPKVPQKYIKVPKSTSKFPKVPKST